MSYETRRRQWEETAEQVRLKLRDCVKRAAVSQRQIEEAAGWSRGYLSQVLQGHITLTVAHLLIILDMLDLSVAQFLADALDIPLVGDEIRQKMATYDEAFAELRRRGLLGDT